MHGELRNKNNMENEQPIWDLKSGIQFCRKIEKQLSEVGYHCALTGGVLYNSKSFKDLDVMVYPHSHKQHTFTDAIACLKEFCDVYDLEPALSDDEKYDEDCKDIWYAKYQGKRIDFFFVR
jgi:hypothetical protein